MGPSFESQGISTLNQLFHQRAIDQDQTPLLAFPKSKNGAADFELFSGRTLYRFITAAAKALADKGFPQLDPDDQDVVGVCSPTDLDYLVTIFALIRLGYTPMQLSTRLAPVAMVKLLKMVQSPGKRHVLLYSSSLAPEKLHSLRQDLELYPLATRDEYDHDVAVDDVVEAPRSSANTPDISNRSCMILHSSGSTGFPKPIHYSHRKILTAANYGQDMTHFVTMPFSHSLGTISYLQAFFVRRTVFGMSGHVPQTTASLTAAMVEAKPEIVYTVPYVLKALAESPEGIEALKNCRIVSSSGSRLPDDLGDLLTSHGVHIGSQYGSTETGLMLSSIYRPREDKAWNYLRPPPEILPYIRFVLISDNQYECVILDGHNGKIMSNSDEPEPNSWRTNDVFEPHPNLPNAWKFVCRLDDRINLINGEKVLPLPFESRVKAHPLVDEAVMFGVDQEGPGLLLFRAATDMDGPSPSESPESSSRQERLSDEEFLDRVWPAVSDANSQAEAFSQVMREMVIIAPKTRKCPTTDKNSIKRAQVYREFADEISAAYQALVHHKTQSLQLSESELEEWIVDAVRSHGSAIHDATTDFFAAGMDSLQATRLRSHILRNIDLGGHEEQCTAMIAFECGNARSLAARLYEIRTGNGQNEQAHESSSANRNKKITDLIDKYSKFSSSKAAETIPESADKVVVLTGATGFLGSHVLAALIAANKVHKIYALIRSSPRQNDTATASTRLAATLKERGFADLALDKVVCVYHDLAKADNLGIEPPHLYEALKKEVTHIIHCAWSVNFTISLPAFEPQIAGLHNLLSLCMQSRHRVRLQFCSSIGVAQGIQSSAPIPSEALPSLEMCGDFGYAQSKLIGERIVESAVKDHGLSAMVLRIGQIVPGRRRGVKLWNPSEAIPLMIRPAIHKEGSIGALPVVGPGRDVCDWIEVDTLADTVVQLAGLDATDVDANSSGGGGRSSIYYNLVNPRIFSWEKDLLPALRDTGLVFDILPWQEWLDRLANSTDDLTINPTKKLLGFWTSQTHRDDPLRFDTTVSEAASPALRQSLRLLDQGFLRQIVDAWRQAS
ncbi:putative NRPS-like protein biosynthetic cluster [Claviceps maximensis]|nr:putative NRPS-like protein biosynthetic cluster [Claviceps maximensis]